MQSLLSMLAILLTAAVSAQTGTVKMADVLKDSVSKDKDWFIPNRTDTAGMSQYGMRLYDPRTLRYMPAAPASMQRSPYEFATNNPIVLDELPDSTRKQLIAALDYHPFSFTDTTGMGQYGLRLYDPRIGRYLPMEAGTEKAPLHNLAKKPTTAIKKKKQQQTTNNK